MASISGAHLLNAIQHKTVPQITMHVIHIRKITNLILFCVTYIGYLIFRRTSSNLSTLIISIDKVSKLRRIRFITDNMESTVGLSFKAIRVKLSEYITSTKPLRFNHNKCRILTCLLSFKSHMRAMPMQYAPTIITIKVILIANKTFILTFVELEL